MSRAAIEGRLSVTREGYGPEARRYVETLPPDLHVVAADFDGAAVALAAAIERKMVGDAFFVAPLVEDPRAIAAQTISCALLRTFVDVDDRRHAFDALADDGVWGATVGTRSFEFRNDDVAAIDRRAHVALNIVNPYADVNQRIVRLDNFFGVTTEERLSTRPYEAGRRVLRDFALMGDAILVRSSLEAARVASLLGRRRPFTATAPGEDTTIPDVRSRRKREKIVVWARSMRAERLGVLAMAIDHIKADVVYICASGSIEGVHGRFVAGASTVDVAETLATAACIIDASVSDPGSAIALARLEVPVVASITAGAGEFLDGVYEYEPWNWRTVLAAVSAARGAVPPAPKRAAIASAELGTTLKRAATPAVSAEPQVTIAIPTFNRPELLKRTLTSLATQTYKNIDAIVVNNGDNVDDVVARYPFARLINSEGNQGPYRALVVAQQAMNGEYFGWLGDDDTYFPDHVSRLVHALEQSGSSVAHSNSVSRFVEYTEGSERVLAHKIQFGGALDPLTILCGATMASGSTICRKKLFLSIGTYDLTIPDADLDLQIRAAHECDFIHVDNVTFCWNQDVSGASYGQSGAAIASLRIVYDRYPSASATVGRIRSANLRRFDLNEPGMYWPPDRILPVGWEEEIRAHRAIMAQTIQEEFVR